MLPVFVGSYWLSGGYFTTEAGSLINMVRDLSASTSLFSVLNQYDNIVAGSCFANCAYAYYYINDVTSWTQATLESYLAYWTSNRIFPGYLQGNYVSQFERYNEIP